MTNEVGLLLELTTETLLLLLHRRQLRLNLLHLILKHLNLLRIDPLILRENRQVSGLPALVVLLEDLDVVNLRVDVGFESTELLPEGRDLALEGTDLLVERRDLAEVRLVLVAKGLVALSEKLGGVDRLEELSVRSGAREGLAGLLTFLLEGRDVVRIV